jgi:hypothetical protein
LPPEKQVRPEFHADTLAGDDRLDSHFTLVSSLGPAHSLARCAGRVHHPHFSCRSHFSGLPAAIQLSTASSRTVTILFFSRRALLRAAFQPIMSLSRHVVLPEPPGAWLTSAFPHTTPLTNARSPRSAVRARWYHVRKSSTCTLVNRLHLVPGRYSCV